MVKQVSRSGFVDWIVQRVTAVLIGVYTIFILIYISDHHSMNYADWRGLFSTIWMRIVTVILLISVLWHAWIGLWTVFTDYVKVKPVRLLLEVIVILLLLGYFIWVLEILWR
jgi:succinate dehydrogenase / fumarate reductase, membrane anchor subunit